MNTAPQEVVPVEGTVEETPRLALVPAPAATPAQLLAIAVQQGASMETLKQFMDLQERHEANEARKAFNAAVADFKKNPPDIIKDKENKQYGSHYATLANLVNNGSAALAPFGLTVDWKIDQSNDKQIKVTCILKHALGHSEQVSITGAPDESGAKNKLQQIKSTITYLKGETFQCVTGITARDCPGDNDGNGAGKPRQGNAQQAVENAAQRREAAHKAKHDEVAAKYSESIDYIKDRIKADDAAAAASEWRQFSQEEMEALWLAPSKGGIFTTREREYLKTNLPKRQEPQA